MAKEVNTGSQIQSRHDHVLKLVRGMLCVHMCVPCSMQAKLPESQDSTGHNALVLEVEFLVQQDGLIWLGCAQGGKTGK